MTPAVSDLIKGASEQTLGALAGILKKGADHAAAIKAPEDVFLSFRLFPDMFPLSRQVQIASDALTRGSARLSGMELPAFPDVETTFLQLIERTQKANAFVQSVSSDAMNARASTLISIPIGGGQELTMTCAAYLQGWILPNLYFHTTTAYNILRHNGVALGKRDFLRPPS